MASLASTNDKSKPASTTTTTTTNENVDTITDSLKQQKLSEGRIQSGS